MHRSRVRTTLLGNNGEIPESMDLFRHTEVKMEQVTTRPEVLDENMARKYKAKMKRIIPYLALNEVFTTISLYFLNFKLCLATGLHRGTPLGPSFPLAAGAGPPGCGKQDQVLRAMCQHGHGLNVLAHQHQPHHQPVRGGSFAVAAQRQFKGSDESAEEL